MITPGTVLCISGIDTDIGKSLVTGLMGRYLMEQGYNVITQKIAQTGCSGIAEDIRLHRRIMGIPLQPVDDQGLTCPYVLAKPCSPHLAASLEDRTIEPETITMATQQLAGRYDIVLLEGVGGLMVPLTQDLLLADYLAELGYCHFLVSSPRLGSINHTLSALEVLQHRAMHVIGVGYNMFFAGDHAIAADTREIISRYVEKYGYGNDNAVGSLVDIMPYTRTKTAELPDFSGVVRRLIEKNASAS